MLFIICKTFFCVPRNNTDLDQFSIGILGVSFGRHRDCKFRFKTDRKIRGYQFNIELIEDRPNMVERGGRSLHTYLHSAATTAK